MILRIGGSEPVFWEVKVAEPDPPPERKFGRKDSMASCLTNFAGNILLAFVKNYVYRNQATQR